MDAAIIFSDILVIIQILGVEVQMHAGSGPRLPHPLRTPSDMHSWKPMSTISVASDLRYVFDAITLTRHALKGRVPLIGFSGAPFTLFCYLIEGGSSHTWNHARRFLYLYPECSHTVMDRLTDLIIEYLVLQVQAGAQMLEV